MMSVINTNSHFALLFPAISVVGGMNVCAINYGTTDQKIWHFIPYLFQQKFITYINLKKNLPSNDNHLAYVYLLDPNYSIT